MELIEKAVNLHLQITVQRNYQLWKKNETKQNKTFPLPRNMCHSKNSCVSARLIDHTFNHNWENWNITKSTYMLHNNPIHPFSRLNTKTKAHEQLKCTCSAPLNISVCPQLAGCLITFKKHSLNLCEIIPQFQPRKLLSLCLLLLIPSKIWTEFVCIFYCFFLIRCFGRLLILCIF